MNLLADEGVDRQIVERLRQDGHEVLYVLEMERSLGDEDVLRHANERNALLLTADKDFGELVFRLGRPNAGVVLVRLAGLSPKIKGEIVTAVFRQHAAEMTQAFSVISPGMVRIRRK